MDVACAYGAAAAAVVADDDAAAGVGAAGADDGMGDVALFSLATNPAHNLPHQWLYLNLLVSHTNGNHPRLSARRHRPIDRRPHRALVADMANCGGLMLRYC